MKKVLKTLFLSLLVAISLLGMVACNAGGGTGTAKKGISGAVVDGNVYEIRKYYAEDGVDTLDIGNLTLPQGVTEIKIKSHAFAGNTTLKKVIVSKNVVEIGKGAFSGMTKLAELELPFVGKMFNADYKQNSSVEGVKAVDAERTIAHLFGTEEYDKGSRVEISYGSSLASVYLPTTLKKIVINNQSETGYVVPMYAFTGATAFTSIELKGNIIGIGEYAFSSVGGIETLNIPASVKTIYANAFSGSLIKNFVFDQSAANVEVMENAFSGCSLLNFVGAGSVSQYTIDLAKFDVAKLGRNAFNLEANEITYTLKNSTGLDKAKVFAGTETK